MESILFYAFRNLPRPEVVLRPHSPIPDNVGQIVVGNRTLKVDIGKSHDFQYDHNGRIRLDCDINPDMIIVSKQEGGYYYLNDLGLIGNIIQDFFYDPKKSYLAYMEHEREQRKLGLVGVEPYTDMRTSFMIYSTNTVQRNNKLFEVGSWHEMKIHVSKNKQRQAF